MATIDFVVQTVEQLLERELRANTLGEWLLALALLLGVVLVLLALRRIVAGRLHAFARRTSTDLDDLGADLVERTRAYFIAAVAVAIAVQTLELPRRILDVARVAVVIATLFQLAVWGNGVIGFALRRYAARFGATDGSQRMMAGVVAFLARVLLWVIIVLLALDNLGFDVTALVAGLGIGGVAVALAVQNILGDLLAAASIIIDKPFVVGDFIVVGEYRGTVEYTGLKTTRIRSLSGEQIVISNSDLLGSRIRNFQRLAERRVVLAFGVTYDTDQALLERIPAVAREIVERQQPVRFDRAHFAGFGESSLNFEVVYFVLSPDYLVFMNVQQAVNLELVSRFRELGIDFAFPTRTLHVTGALTGVVEARDTGARP